MPIEEDEQISKTWKTLIRAYGEYWEREAVDWAEGKLLGERRHYKVTIKNPLRKKKSCDAWKTRGIYALYADFKLVYVGLAGSQEGIGARLCAHNEKARMARRWDSFSWFSIDGFDGDGQLIQYTPMEIDADTIVRTLELTAILIADPLLNRSQGKFPGAEKISQAPPSQSRITNEDLHKKLKEILAAIEPR